MQTSNDRDLFPTSGNIPKIVALGPFTYQVLVEDSSIVDEDNYHQFGEIDYRRREMRGTRFRCSPYSQEESFCHELVHGMIDLAKIRNGEKVGEALVERLGVALYQLLKGNRIYFGK